MSVAIIDYGMGNLASVEKAIRFLGTRAAVTSDPRKVARAGALILPGVGAFGAAMGELRRRKLVEPILDSIGKGKPFLGLCLGLQLLFESSEESPGVRGLKVLRGKVRRFPRGPRLKVPHMGWNGIEIRRPNPLLAGVPEGAFMYFVHSFFADPEDRSLTAARTSYGRPFPSVVWNGGSVWATQFHPEKSQRWGLRILRNFLSIQEKRC